MKAYLITYASSIIGASLLTLWKSGHDTFLIWLATTEVVGAILFLFSKTRFTGTVLLLLVFTVATVAEFASGGLPIRFFVYGASALLIWVMMGWLKTASR